ncbi:MAG: DUF4835 family protein [Saprospiraceae bacterium]
MKLLSIAFLLILGFKAYNQELNAQVKVNTPKLQTVDPRVFRNLEDDIKKFMSTQLWTNDKFELHERIKCNFNLTIKEEVNSTTFKADLTISASRPVFGSTYESTLINYIDKNIVINYEPNRPLNYVQNVFSDRLTALLGFYANLIIGLDYDSFSSNGGSDYFLICQNILNTIPGNIVGEGWKPSDDTRNRYWILENIMSPRLRAMRTAWYSYHRLGLDLMSQSPEEGKTAMAKAMESIDEGKRSYPAAIWLQMFIDAKANEVVDVFKKADKPQQQKIHAILNRLDPSSASRFQPLLQ